ncbi:tetratricopeptide repeat protein [Nitzschia inconspicua]|uniref:Tetratricopeptide repeat protein n=1 Tax=Nitzschia inconspicua TaxID=303405 RepID=A0A9K3LZ25_9STRA|nr:tetratricopeptide repeat protein [Nitzschia inconspicua]
MTSYDPNIVIQAADEKFVANDLTGGQTLYQSALLNWVDDAQFSSDVTDRDQLQEAIATLWIAYAQFLQKAKQFKSATEAYEQAVSCPVGSLVGRVWLDYARFLEERGKLRSAQKVYLRALVDDNGGKVQDEQDRNLLWNEFLEMMKTNKPDLTLAALKKAVQDEHLGDARNSPRPQNVGSGGADTDDDENMYDDLLPDAKRPRIEKSSATIIKQEDTSEESRTHVVTASDVKTEETALEEIIQSAKSDPQFLAAWMVRDGDGQPQSPEVSLFEAAPPKLSDPTGKDLLGEELALHLVQRLLSATGSVILQTCRGLWMMTALTENSCNNRLKELDGSIRDDLESLQQRLNERLSVAGEAEAAVRAVNESEERSFQENCNERRQKMLNDMAWEFRRLLWVQQQFLTKLKIPGFHGTSVDVAELEYQARICSYLHSAFFLRQRIGEDAHVKMLKSQESRLNQLIEDQSMMMATGGTSTVPSGNNMAGYSPKFGSTGARLSPAPMTRNSPVPNFHLHPPPMPASLPLPPQQVYQRMPPQMPHSYSGGIPAPGTTPGYPPHHMYQQQQQVLPPPYGTTMQHPPNAMMPQSYTPQPPYHNQLPPQNPPYY